MLFYRRRGRSPTARARARRRAPHSPHRTHDVFRGVFRDHRAMRVRRLAGASIHRGARVLRAAIFGRATRDARARDATTTRATRDDDDDGNATSPSTARARGLRGRGERAAARARGETGRDNFERAMRGGGGGRARAMREGTGATFDVTLAAAALSLHASGEASRDAAREDGARGTEMRGNG